MKWTQQDAPLMDALKEHLLNRVVRFDVPGHKAEEAIRNSPIFWETVVYRSM